MSETGLPLPPDVEERLRSGEDAPAEPEQAEPREPLPSPDTQRLGAFHDPAASGSPETERLAAIRAYPTSGTKRRKVLDYIARQGERGAIDEEVSDALSMRLYTAAPRRNELVRDGWVVDSGRRRQTSTGSQAVVWVLSPAGRAQWQPDAEAA